MELNKNYKKKIMVLIISLLLCITSCSGKSEIINSGYSEKVSENIIECFNNKDVDGLIQMISPYVLETREVEEQIKNAYEVIEGTITSYEVLSFGYDGSIRDGKWVIKNEQVKIHKVITDNGEEYIIDYSEYITNKDDKSKEGIYLIILRDKDNELIQKIGGIKKENT